MIELRVVLFDLDDTLYPEIDFVFSGFRAVARWASDSLGLSEETSYQRLTELFHNGIRGNTFNFWLGELGHKDPENVNRAITVYRNHIPVLHLFPEVPGLLKTLKSRFLLGIVTDGDWRIQERKITALGLTEFFTAIVLTDQLGPDSSKPSPKPFLAALERLGVTAESTCYIGDNIRKDFLGARKVGLKTIWIRKNDGIYSGIEPPTPDHRPDFIIDSLSKLEKLLATL